MLIGVAPRLNVQLPSHTEDKVKVCEVLPSLISCVLLLPSEKHLQQLYHLSPKIIEANAKEQIAETLAVHHISF